MANREAFTLKYITAAHNLFLCLWSLVMCVGLTYHLFMFRLDTKDLSTVYCSKGYPDASNVFYWLCMIKTTAPTLTYDRHLLP